MRNYAAIFAAIILAFAFLSAEVSAASALDKCKKDLRKVQSSFVVGRSKDAFETNKAQDFCAVFKNNKSIRQANGTQIFTGVCSNTPQGNIPKVENMPSTYIVEPDNGQKIKAKKRFTVKVLTKNIQLGFFSDPAKQYNVFPQELNEEGVIQGHNHITIQYLGRNKESIPDATKFAFFKGLNGNEDRKGQLSVNVDIGLPKKGIYRICTMSASFAHTCLVLPKAQRGASDDCIRVYVY